MKQIGGLLKEAKLEVVRVKLVREIICDILHGRMGDRSFILLEGCLQPEMQSVLEEFCNKNKDMFDEYKIRM